MKYEEEFEKLEQAILNRGNGEYDLACCGIVLRLSDMEPEQISYFCKWLSHHGRDLPKAFEYFCNLPSAFHHIPIHFRGYACQTENFYFHYAHDVISRYQDSKPDPTADRMAQKIEDDIETAVHGEEY